MVGCDATAPFVIPVRVGSLEMICSRGTPVKTWQNRGVPRVARKQLRGSNISQWVPHPRLRPALRDRPTSGKSAGAIEADQPIEPVNLGQPLMAHATLMVIEGVNNDVFGAAVRVICGVDGRRRACFIHERY